MIKLNNKPDVLGLRGGISELTFEPQQFPIANFERNEREKPNGDFSLSEQFPLLLLKKNHTSLIKC
jgi:hypothetical protein